MLHWFRSDNKVRSGVLYLHKLHHRESCLMRHFCAPKDALPVRTQSKQINQDFHGAICLSSSDWTEQSLRFRQKLQVSEPQYAASGGFGSVINMMSSRERVASLSEIGHRFFCARSQMYWTTNQDLSSQSPLAAECIARWIVDVISLPISACVLWKSAACFRSVSWSSFRFLTSYITSFDLCSLPSIEIGARAWSVNPGRESYAPQWVSRFSWRYP